MSAPPTDYRSRIYAAYVSRGHGQELRVDRAAASRRARYLAKVLAGWLPEDREATIADLGCGAGDVLAAFDAFGYTRLAGVDRSSEQVQLAQKIAPRVVEGDLFEYLADQAATLDLATGFDIIEHLGKDEALAFLDVCHRALKPGGRLVLQTPNAESPWGPAIRYGDFTHEVCFTPASLSWLLRLCGFERVEAREAGPRALGVASWGRVMLWRAIRSVLALWNIAETGSKGSGIYTRVFLISAVKSSATKSSASASAAR
ncbi:MAG: class I SAM-dependent methyltransferase [Acidobacteriota bacterium]